MNTNASKHYPKLQHTADELSAYYIYENYCILSLKDNQRTLIFVPDDIKQFHEWLEAHKIRRVRVEEL